MYEENPAKNTLPKFMSSVSWSTVAVTLVVVAIVSAVAWVFSVGSSSLNQKQSTTGESDNYQSPTSSPQPTSTSDNTSQDRYGNLETETSSVSGTITSPTSSTTASPTTTSNNAGNSNSSNTASSSSGTSYKTYRYDYLQISFNHPNNWNVSVEKKNSNDDVVDCSDNYSVEQFLRITRLCVNNKIYPETFTISGPSGEKIVLSRPIVFGVAPDDELMQTIEQSKKVIVQMYGNTYEIELYEKDGKLLNLTPIVIKTGPQSSWKYYMMSVEAPSQKKSDVINVLKSFKFS